jgi:hypothetical protein
MTRRHTITLLVAGLAAALAAGAASAAAPNHSSLVIRHQVRGCHTWSVNGGAFRASQTIALRHGGWITVRNNDVMPHKLIKTSGPAVRFVGKPSMNHMSATVKVIFAKAGTYRFTTKVGEDYMPGMKTVGEDNVLHLTVRVS